MRKTFFFEAQTGIIRHDRPAFSNYYQYEFDNELATTIREMVENAEPGPHGLEWSDDDLDFFSYNDKAR